MNDIESAIKKISGPCAILAGAGTGKTHTIVEKIKYLIEKKIYPAEKILCITFSNEACNNIITRLRKSLKEEKEPNVKTFHSFSSDLLRKHATKLDIKENFSILDENEAKIILHKNFKVSVANCHKYVSSISIAKDLGITKEKIEDYITREKSSFPEDIEAYLKETEFEFQTRHIKKDKTQKKAIVEEIQKAKNILDLKKFITSWTAYEKIKKIKNYLDYSDLNKYALELLKNFPHISNEFEYIIVDEFQDTNKIQLDMIFSLNNENITIVGDLNQSIYRFRGAYKENFAEFKTKYSIKNEDIFNLNKSFRSPNKILRTAHKLIEKNYEKKEDCFPVENANNAEGEQIEIYELKNGKEEARKVKEIIIKEAHSKKLEDICVLFRTHQQGRIIKKVLESEKIPFCYVSRSSLLKQKSIKTVIDYLNIINNIRKKSKGGEKSWWNLIYNLELQEKDLIKVGKLIDSYKFSENFDAKILNSIQNLDLDEYAKNALSILTDKIKKMIQIKESNSPEIISEIYKISGIMEEQKTPETKEITLNLNKFLEIAKNHSEMYSPDLESFMNHLESIDALGIEIESSDIEEKGVRLMTLHATKGLEFKTIILTNMAQNKFPIIKNSSTLIPLELFPDIENKKISHDQYLIEEYDKKSQLFEERRLCYVALTRAKENLYITYALKYGERKFSQSQFLEEINYKENPEIIFIPDYEETPYEKLNPLGIFIEKEKEFEDKITFSPSALLLFSECEKKYEYKYKYKMPEEKIISWEELRLGSFIHLVLEKGVESKLKALNEFLGLARDLSEEEEWESINLEEAEQLVRVFYERNKDKFNEYSRTEQQLKTKIEELNFVGFADRIDFHQDGIEIIDYKTGKSSIPPKNRNWQLGYYILAASEIGKVKKVTLDMLKQEKPLEFEVLDTGVVKATNSSRMEFNINEVKKELIEEAKKILHAYKTSFKPCPIEKNCEFCNEYIYRI